MNDSFKNLPDHLGVEKGKPQTSVNGTNELMRGVRHGQRKNSTHMHSTNERLGEFYNILLIYISLACAKVQEFEAFIFCLLSIFYCDYMYSSSSNLSVSFHLSVLHDGFLTGNQCSKLQMRWWRWEGEYPQMVQWLGSAVQWLGSVASCITSSHKTDVATWHMG